MRVPAKTRAPLALQVLGAILLVIFGGLPALLKLLHNFGILQGWDGFGFFVISLRLLPWMVGAGISSLVLGTALKVRQR